MDRITRIGIVGVGQVGMAAAYSLFQRRLASELVLVDLDRDRAEGEAMDLLHGQALVGRVAVRAGDLDDLEGADLVVITAGVAQRNGESRLDLLQRNVDVMATSFSIMSENVAFTSSPSRSTSGSAEKNRLRIVPKSRKSITPSLLKSAMRINVE